MLHPEKNDQSRNSAAVQLLGWSLRQRGGGGGGSVPGRLARVDVDAVKQVPPRHAVRQKPARMQHGVSGGAGGPTPGPPATMALRRCHSATDRNLCSPLSRGGGKRGVQSWWCCRRAAAAVVPVQVVGNWLEAPRAHRS